jgi:hypothetical protein
MDNHRTYHAKWLEKPAISPLRCPWYSHKRDTAGHLKHAHSMHAFRRLAIDHRSHTSLRAERVCATIIFYLSGQWVYDTFGLCSTKA